MCVDVEELTVMEVDPHATAFAELAALLEKQQYRAAVKKSDERMADPPSL